ncbi:Hypothetical protein SRAE_2000179800 [Strongyloides ratti]|uniref:Uncharacterized protein n=1 Tax=Strongyloides ratti TaxID=34506 RepID=A0A090LG71_STRRB|nr:Hypothetical protein SRAE_2000179800 [Strongyloides ratti]CEF67133.1 Hypothetical protein SRAE_2000179800 [Strongyloides ratti]
MDRSTNDSADLLEQYVGNKFNTLVPDIAILDPKTVTLKDVYTKFRNFNNKLKNLTVEKEFELKKIQVKKKYLDMSVMLGKEELELKAKELDEKRYSAQKLLDLLISLKNASNNNNMNKTYAELTNSYQDLKDTILWSEETCESSRTNYENVKLKNKKNLLKSDVEQLRSRLKHVKNEVYKQDKNNIYKWIIEMCSLSIEEKKLYSTLEKRKNENTRLTDKNPNNSLNESVLPLSGSQLSVKSNFLICKNDNAFNKNNDNESDRFSSVSSVKEEENNLTQNLYNSKGSSMEHINEINKLLNDSLAPSQCSILSSEMSDICSNRSNDDIMDFMPTNSDNSQVKSKLVNFNSSKSSNRRIDDYIKYIEENSKDFNFDNLSDVSDINSFKHNEMPKDFSNLGITNLFTPDQKERSYEIDLPNKEIKPADETETPKCSNIINNTIGGDFINDEENSDINVEKKSDEVSRTVIFNDDIDIMEISKQNLSNEDFTIVSNLNENLDADNFNDDEICFPDDEGIFNFLNATNPIINESGNSDVDIDDGFNFDLNMLDGPLSENDSEPMNDNIFDNVISKNNTGSNEFDSLFDFK